MSRVRRHSSKAPVKSRTGTMTAPLDGVDARARSASRTVELSLEPPIGPGRVTPRVGRTVRDNASAEFLQQRRLWALVMIASGPFQIRRPRAIPQLHASLQRAPGPANPEHRHQTDGETTSKCRGGYLLHHHPERDVQK